MKNPVRVLAGLKGSAVKFQEASRANRRDVEIYQVARTFAVLDHEWTNANLRVYQRMHRTNSLRARQQLLRVLELKSSLE